MSDLVFVPVSRLRFAQANCSSHFRDGRPLETLLNEVLANPDKVRTMPLQTTTYRGELYTLCHRRTVVFKLAARLLGISLFVQVESTSIYNLRRTDRRKFDLRPFMGESIRIRRGILVQGRRVYIVWA